MNALTTSVGTAAIAAAGLQLGGRYGTPDVEVRYLTFYSSYHNNASASNATGKLLFMVRQSRRVGL